MHQILSQKVNVAIANDKEAWHFCWASLYPYRHLLTSLTVSQQPSIATHGRDYEDCKQFLKLSLNLTRTLKRPERLRPLPKDRHCPQTFLFGQSGIRRCCLSASSSDKINNGITASGNSGKHQPSAPSALCTSEKVSPTSLGMSLFLDAPFPTGTDRCRLSLMERPKSVTS